MAPGPGRAVWGGIAHVRRPLVPRPQIPGKKRVFTPYAVKFPVYVAEVEDVVVKGYEGFLMA